MFFQKWVYTDEAQLLHDILLIYETNLNYLENVFLCIRVDDYSEKRGFEEKGESTSVNTNIEINSNIEINCYPLILP